VHVIVNNHCTATANLLLVRRERTLEIGKDCRVIAVSVVSSVFWNTVYIT